MAGYLLHELRKMLEALFLRYSNGTKYNFDSLNTPDGVNIFIFSDGIHLLWPSLDETGNISIERTYACSSDNFEISGIHLLSIGPHIYLYACCIPHGNMSDLQPHIIAYEIELIDLKINKFRYVNEFIICYTPLKIRSIKFNGSQFVIISGCDNIFHFYEASAESGMLSRVSENKEKLKMFWDKMFETSQICISHLYDSIEGSGQAITGHVDGYLYWSRYSSDMIEDSSPEILPTVQYRGAKRFETPITSLCLYRFIVPNPSSTHALSPATFPSSPRTLSNQYPYHSPTRNSSENNNNNNNVSRDRSGSVNTNQPALFSHVLVGLADGMCVAVNLFETESKVLTPLPGSFIHGAVQDVARGALRLRKYEDVVSNIEYTLLVSHSPQQDTQYIPFGDENCRTSI